MPSPGTASWCWSATRPPRRGGATSARPRRSRCAAGAGYGAAPAGSSGGARTGTPRRCGSTPPGTRSSRRPTSGSSSSTPPHRPPEDNDMDTRPAVADPWSVAADGALGAALNGCLEAAIAAPSIHNSQPWRLAVRRGGVDLYADPGRRLAARDQLLGLARSADRLLRRDAGYRAELTAWTGSCRLDGVPRAAFGPWDALETLPLRDFGLTRPDEPRRSAHFEARPTLVVLSTV